MPLATITLNSGRQVVLDHLDISPTYDGMLEGYPCARVNDSLLESLAKPTPTPFQTSPVHLIAPERRYPDRGSGRRLPFGPVEELPRLYCRGSFVSERVDENLDDVLYRSWLEIVWFQDDLAAPVADFVARAIADVAWDELAEDFEL
ncbi:hypothetical protein DZF91_31720 [Actinomadura logoneensis]|uniref:Uncharacterized protein n=1 Tax=Actinomadura logoneensis TaxID=2293572 RepID=A0A372JCC7_9ACTN|nr:hypothetical protein [Actinomadura logoneensis]RFU37665.1 hypothetical protein DZF91_31720 [Actinomadura logoneensis]